VIHLPLVYEHQLNVPIREHARPGQNSHYVAFGFPKDLLGVLQRRQTRGRILLADEAAILKGRVILCRKPQMKQSVSTLLQERQTARLSTERWLICQMNFSVMV